MSLQLKKPLAVIDLETTGTHLGTDRIIEIAIIKLLPDGNQVVKRKIINPQMAIPKSVTELHGITDEMVKDAPVFKQVANELKQILDGCDLAGYNSNRFDIPMLMEEFLRAGVDFDMKSRRLVDVQKIFHLMEQRTLSAAYKFYCNKISSTILHFKLNCTSLSRFRKYDAKLIFIYHLFCLNLSSIN